LTSGRYLFEADQGDEVEAESGTFSVPENLRSASGEQIELAFVPFNEEALRRVLGAETIQFRSRFHQQLG